MRNINKTYPGAFLLMCTSGLKWKWRIKIYITKLDPEHIWHFKNTDCKLFEGNMWLG